MRHAGGIRAHPARRHFNILPTGFECRVLNGKVEPGSTVAIVGAGSIGLAALLTAQFYSPAQIVMIDRDASFRASRPPSATYAE